MNSKWKTSRLAAVLVIIAGLLPVTSSAHLPTPPKQPSDIGRRVVNAAVPDFKLTDQDGKPFRLSATRGKPVLVTFGFTTCPDVCPLLSAKFAAIQRTLEAKQFTDYHLVTITTDPERDRAAALKKYGEAFKADLRRWSFLTGSKNELAKVWKIFHVNVTKTQSGDVHHTSLTTLIDRGGKRRVDYYGDRWHEKEILEDIEWLAGQK